MYHDHKHEPSQKGELARSLRYLDRTTTRGKLVMADGDVLEGYSFGAEKSVYGEVVFNTGMVGYPEALTDPSYTGQILVLTSPMIGNYGVPSEEKDENGISYFFESEKVHVAGLIVTDYSVEYSHWNAWKSLSQWLISSGVPALFGIDTRRLTKRIREQGAVLGKITFPDQEIAGFENPNGVNLVAQVSTRRVTTYGDGNSPRIIAFDCGMKHNIVRYLVYREKVCLTVVPHDYDLASNPADIEYDGIFVSNGPGDPQLCTATIASLRWAMDERNISPPKPIFGICLGNQLLALACGARTYKMKYGNRGMNQPCIDLRTSRCYITSQNHGYAVDGSSLPPGWKSLFVNANDHTNEGIIHSSRPFFSVQFHPEACGGPHDTLFLFSDFVDMVRGAAPQRVLLEPALFESRPIRKVLLIGSGGLSIGQAGEFDYSGSQAIKALKEEGIEVVLINPNIATVQTSKHLGRSSPDVVYFLPITREVCEEVLRKERPDGCIVSMGGQTALNVGIELHRCGAFERHHCRVLGTPIETIIATEDRQVFAERLQAIQETLARSGSASTVQEAADVAKKIGYPVLVRAAFALGGLGSGFAENEAELRELAAKALAQSDQLLVDQDLRGWKEVEYEVVRDCRDNCITVCNMENFDPLGVHTGDSIVVAPSQTLSNSEYYQLRATSIKVIRALGIVGECNIQYALNPASEEYCIIEVNARLSRSSALASKATGYPLAYVATKLSLGKDLVSIRNSINKTTTACFEPSLDYCVVKVPRWDLSKFSKVSTRLGSSMTSVGEVMAIGRTFEEAIQKACRMVSGGVAEGLDGELADGADLTALLSVPTDRRLTAVQLALERGYSIDDIHRLSRIDRWFLSRLKIIADIKAECLSIGALSRLSVDALQTLKIAGFSDRQIARYTSTTEMVVRRRRLQLGVTPYTKQIDTLAAEFPAETNYLYMTYNGAESDASAIQETKPPGKGVEAQLQRQEQLSSARHADGSLLTGGVMVLGCGAYCIGSSVEFDWCAVSAVRQVRAMGDRAIVVNYNPETVSTDYDESDRLYFEELTLERVLDVYEAERSAGVVVSVGGQIPNNLALPLHQQGVRVLGTSPDSIDQAEDRHKFSALLDRIKVDQPEWKELTTVAAAQAFAAEVGYPVLVRPSFVLSGAAMAVASTQGELRRRLQEALGVSPDKPVVISKFYLNAKEIEFDAVAQNGRILNYAISEHVENAGVHSGDATLILPAQRLYVQTVRQVKTIASQIAAALKISGPFNLQLLARANAVKVIECNLRASRTFPFVSKTLDVNFITLATKVMLGYPCKPYQISLYDYDYVAVKAPIFSFTRLRGADPTLGVEMHSTGEVACFGHSPVEAFLQALLATAFRLPQKHPDRHILVSIAQDRVREEFLESLLQLQQLGHRIAATPGTAAYYLGRGVQGIVVLRKPEDRSGSGRNGGGGPVYSGTMGTVDTSASAATGDDAELPLSSALALAQSLAQGEVLDWIRGGRVDLLINIPEGSTRSDEVTAGYLMRRAAVDFGCSLLTNIKCAVLFCDALSQHVELPCRSVDDFVSVPPTVGGW